MTTTVAFHQKKLRVELSPAADRALAARGQPLLAELELYFSCLIRKKVRFHDVGDDTDTIAVNDQLWLRFRPVMTARCATDYEGDEPPLTDFPIVRTDAFVPDWLRVDYRAGKWYGEFGYGGGSSAS